MRTTESSSLALTGSDRLHHEGRDAVIGEKLRMYCVLVFHCTDCNTVPKWKGCVVEVSLNWWNCAYARFSSSEELFLPLRRRSYRNLIPKRICFERFRIHKSPTRNLYICLPHFHPSRRSRHLRNLTSMGFHKLPYESGTAFDCEQLLLTTSK